MGREVKSIPINQNLNEIIFNVEDLSNGLYFLQLLGDDYKSSTKFIKN